MDPVTVFAASNLVSKILPNIISPLDKGNSAALQKGQFNKIESFDQLLDAVNARGINHFSTAITAENVLNQLNDLPEVQLLLSRFGAEGTSWQLNDEGELGALLNGTSFQALKLSPQSEQIVKNLFEHARQMFPPFSEFHGDSPNLQIDLLGPAQKPALTWLAG